MTIHRIFNKLVTTECTLRRSRGQLVPAFLLMCNEVTLMEIARTLSLGFGLALLATLLSRPAAGQELFGVNVVVVPQSDSPVRIRQINIGEGENADSPEIIVENLTSKPIHYVAFSTWIAQPRNCYDESRIPRDPVEHRAYFSNPPLLPHEAKKVDSVDPGFLDPALPLKDLLLHAPTPTVGYAQVQVAVERVEFLDPHSNRPTWDRQHSLRGKALPAFDAELYKQDRPDCGKWQAVVPRLRSMVGTEILVRQPSWLRPTGAGILRSGESGYFYTCAYVQRQDKSAFFCPSLSGLVKRYSGKP